MCVHTRAATCSGPRSCRPCCAHPPCARLSPGPAGTTSAAPGRDIWTCLSCHRRLSASAWGARRSLQRMAHFHRSCNVLVQDSTPPCKSPVEILSLGVCTKTCSAHVPACSVQEGQIRSRTVSAHSSVLPLRLLDGIPVPNQERWCELVAGCLEVLSTSSPSPPRGMRASRALFPINTGFTLLPVLSLGKVLHGPKGKQTGWEEQRSKVLWSTTFPSSPSGEAGLLRGIYAPRLHAAHCEPPATYLPPFNVHQQFPKSNELK